MRHQYVTKDFPNESSGFPSQISPQVIQGELIGSDQARAFALTARGSSPVFDLCRKLVSAGYSRACRLELFRNGRHALTVHSIGEGALLKIREGERGLYFTRWKAFSLHDVFTGTPAKASGGAPLPFEHERLNQPT